jgi:hypothetical protein
MEVSSSSFVSLQVCIFSGKAGGKFSMAKQSRQPQRSTGRNDTRSNGKAWKRSWGNNPPVEQSKTDSEMNKRKKAK